MMGRKPVSPLTRQRAFATIQVVAKAMLAGESALTYSELARRLGMAKVNGQGLASYLNEAAAMCVEHDLPNVACMVVSKDSLDQGVPMPSEGSFSDGFYAASGLARADVAAEQDRVRTFDWANVGSLGLRA